MSDAFDPARPCTSFPPPPRRRARRHANPLLFLAQGERRFVAKSFDDADRLRRELAAMAAFAAAGARTLVPVCGPADALALVVDGRGERLVHAMVFRFIDAPTLQDEIARAHDAAPLVRAAASRIAARHGAAATLDAIHSDGSAHNVFADWTWFDFSDPHGYADLPRAKAFEVLRFAASVVEVSRAGAAGPRVADFCDVYGDREVLEHALVIARDGKRLPHLRGWLHRIARPDKVVRFLRGETRLFRRARTLDALTAALRGPVARATSPT